LLRGKLGYARRPTVLDAIELIWIRTVTQADVYPHTALERTLDHDRVVDVPDGVFEVGTEPRTGTLYIPHQ
jgi:hypothetical protein